MKNPNHMPCRITDDIYYGYDAICWDQDDQYDAAYEEQLLKQQWEKRTKKGRNYEI